MDVAQRFQALVDRDESPTLDELDEVYDAAEAIGVEGVLGEWAGGIFGLGHPVEAQLEAIRWAGKSFAGPDDVAPIVCFDESGQRFANPSFGGARLTMRDYRGSATATMVYQDLPMADHFRRISDTILIGAMETPGQKRPGYFYLTKLTAPQRPRDLAFVASTPPRAATAAVLHEAGAPFALAAVEIEAPRPDEVLVRIEASGICHTDLVVAGMATPQQLPLVLGHEGAGIIESVGSEVTDLHPGDRVVLSYAWCGNCRNCRRDRMAYCARSNLLNLSGVRLDGSGGARLGETPVRARFCGQSSFATYALAAAHTVVPVPDDVPFEVLAPLGCGVQTGAGTVLNTLQPEPGSSIAVFAAGSVGLSAVMAAKVAGCDQIIAVDPNAQRRELAVALGATTAVDPADAKRVTRHGVDYAIDCIGKPGVIRAALAGLASSGVCATVGLQGTCTPIEVDQAKLVGTGQTLRGVVEGEAVPRTFIPRLIQLYKNGQLPVERIVTTFPLERINDAIAATRHGTVVKAVLIP
ncbi:alcohol dehydrogenase catalytic domain-containing protein [Mycobacterium sp. pUA109]|uniref:alcohol dehydrogenase catalytic domain-containing protein n=1 Tax=Mycobacterium sp. pUA109 TaxID=3238982 RepID=UPI00351BBB59